MADFDLLASLETAEVHTVLTGKEWVLIQNAGKVLLSLRVDGRPVVSPENANQLYDALKAMETKATRTH